MLTKKTRLVGTSTPTSVGRPGEDCGEDADDEREHAGDEPPDGVALAQAAAAQHLDDDDERDERGEDAEDVAGDAHRRSMLPVVEGDRGSHEGEDEGHARRGRGRRPP